MKLLQFLIVAAVLFSNVHWQWTPNGYLAALLAVAAAWLMTVFPVKIADWLGRGRRQLQARFGQQQLHQRIALRGSPAQRRR